MKEVFERKISKTQSKFKMSLQKKDVTQQCSYNLELSLESFLLENDLLVRENLGEDMTNVNFSLRPDYHLELGNNIYAIIGNKYRSKNNKVVFTHTEGANGTSKKIQLIKTDFKNKKDEDYSWFIDLYDKNIEGTNFTTKIDLDNKIVSFDIELTEEMFNCEAVDDSDKELDDIIKKIYLEKDFDYHETNDLYYKFISLYGKNALMQLSGKDLLYRLFANKEKNKDSLIYNLEYNKNYQYFGGIGGGSSYKFNLYFSEERQSWVYGTHSSNIVNITENEAINYATSFKDSMINLMDCIDEHITSDGFVDDSNYTIIEGKAKEELKNLYCSGWILKYLHMLYPNLFGNSTNDYWINKIDTILGLPKEGSFYKRNYVFSKYAHSLKIPNVYLHHIARTLEGYDFSDESNETVIEDFDYYSSPIKDGHNLVVYGTPGCGKSYYVEHTLLVDFDYIRTTFYQDYTNTDFVGQILPVVEGEKVTYEFNPGPFTLALEKAIKDPNHKVALVIEELNRGSAASIFGDIFQLLDRKNGVSEYGIKNVNIIKYLNKQFEKQYKFNEIKLPGNFFIFATMNTSDQNVFTLDTAFKRRWGFKKLLNKFESNHSFKDKYIPGLQGEFNKTWEELVSMINDFILSNNDGLNNEDKQLGVYFVDESGMRKSKEDVSTSEQVDAFCYKVLEYLWSDVSKFQRSKWFVADIKSFDELVEEYKKQGLKVFNDDVTNKK